MALLVLGLILWFWPHVMKEYTPGLRARMGDKKARPLVAVAALIAIILMVIGYRSADVVFVYAPPVWGVHVTHLLMLFSVAFFGAANGKSHLRSAVRHPMFTGTILWGVGHLLISGDLASIILFGGMIVWAVAGWIVSNRNHPDAERFTGGTLKGDIILVVATIVAYVVIVLIHSWIGPSPFPGMF